MKENITIKSQKSFLRFKNVILNVGACLGGGGWGGGIICMKYDLV